MTEAEKDFYSDSYRKKNIARSARNKRTHAGKGGRVRLPHDHLTKKELEKMNGECKAYRLNDPMSWNEFKKLPDDLKKAYIKLLRERFDVTTRQTTEMLGTNTYSLGEILRRLDIADRRGLRRHPDNEAWNAWVRGVKEEPVEDCETESAEERNPAPVVDDTCVPDENSTDENRDAIRPDWEGMYKAIHARACELHDQLVGLRREVDRLRKENAELMDAQPDYTNCVTKEWHDKVVGILERDNEIFRAKMSVVELIFGKR